MVRGEEVQEAGQGGAIDAVGFVAVEGFELDRQREKTSHALLLDRGLDVQQHLVVALQLGLHFYRPGLLAALLLLLHSTALHALPFRLNAALLRELDPAAVGLDLLLSIGDLLDEVVIVDDPFFLSVVRKHQIDILPKTTVTLGCTTTPHLATALKKSRLER